MMREHGGFEGNAQTLRIVSRLEPYSDGHGMNLTRRTLLGFIKYPAFINDLWHTIPAHNPKRAFIKADDWRPAKGLYLDDKETFDWIIDPLSSRDKHNLSHFSTFDEFRSKTAFKSLDAAIMELADDIAYAVHDLEDAIATEQITLKEWENYAVPALDKVNCQWLETSELTARLFLKSEAQRKDVIGELVNLFITQSFITPTEITFDCPILNYTVDLSGEYQKLLDTLKSFIYQRLIRSSHMQQIEFKGQKLIIELFEAFSCEPLRLLPETTAQIYKHARDNGMNTQRVICDYLSGMTDEYAFKTHQRLFSSNN